MVMLFVGYLVRKMPPNSNAGKSADFLLQGCQTSPNREAKRTSLNGTRSLNMVADARVFSTMPFVSPTSVGFQYPREIMKHREGVAILSILGFEHGEGIQMPCHAFTG